MLGSGCGGKDAGQDRKPHPAYNLHVHPGLLSHPCFYPHIPFIPDKLLKDPKILEKISGSNPVLTPLRPPSLCGQSSGLRFFRFPRIRSLTLKVSEQEPHKPEESSPAQNPEYPITFAWLNVTSQEIQCQYQTPTSLGVQK